MAAAQVRRLGETWVSDPSPRVARFLRENEALELIDVSGAAGTTGRGSHAYFRKSPWVSSDILTLLAHDLEPAARGLDKDSGRLVWTFPDDYVERARSSLIERGLAGPAANR